LPCLIKEQSELLLVPSTINQAGMNCYYPLHVTGLTGSSGLGVDFDNGSDRIPASLNAIAGK
jgi:hypothetical protein